MRYRRLMMLGLLLGMPAVSQGAVLTFALEGSVDTVSNVTGPPIGIHQGDRAILTYTFNSDAPHNQNVGSYDGIASSLRIGNEVFTTVGVPDLFVQERVYSAFAVKTSTIGLQSSGWTTFELGSDRTDIFPDGSLPETPPDLSLFTFKRFQVTINDSTGSPQIYIGGSIDSSYAVPEPLTAMLLSVGGLLMGGHRRSRLPRVRV